MKILFNARIYTLDPMLPQASVLVIESDRIRAIGGDELLESFGLFAVQVRFSPDDCKTCSSQFDCTRSILGIRRVSFKPQAEYEALQAAHERQKTDEFKQTYKKRAGIEGTISQGTRVFNLRRSRYLGLAKTHLQHLATAAAMNLARTSHWLMEGESQRSCSPFAALVPI
jgi:hypothetical protein